MAQDAPEGGPPYLKNLAMNCSSQAQLYQDKLYRKRVESSETPSRKGKDFGEWIVFHTF